MSAKVAPQVIIVGAGPVGLAAALELARFGVRSILIEKHDGISSHPKTRNFNTRTMEIARGWGASVYKRLRSIDTPDGWKSPIRFLRSATGEEVGRIESKGFEGPGPEISPALPVMSSQEKIESILLDGVRATGLVDVCFGVEVTRVIAGGNPSDMHAAVEILDRKTGAVEQVSALALVAADGAASLVRNTLGLKLEGPKELSHVVNCYFRADIETLIGERKGVLLFVSNAGAKGVLQPLDGAGRWLCQINVTPDQWSLETFTKDRARQWVRAAAGAPELDVEVLSLGLWQMNATVVERLVQNRIVICGDAAHQFPPTGGLGVNTGLQGMHNAMWKLAYCVKGIANWPLLETYHAERRSVSQQITNQSLQNSMNVGRIFNAAYNNGKTDLDTEEVVRASRRYGNHLGVEFGAFYQSAAVVSDGSMPPAVNDPYSDYQQTATPGCRAPHIWLGRSDAAFSSVDLIGSSLTLLAGKSGDQWQLAAIGIARRLGIPIDTYIIGSAGLQDDGQFARIYDIEDSGAVLMRPDGHVAWRSKSAGADTQLESAVSQLLAL